MKGKICLGCCEVLNGVLNFHQLDIREATMSEKNINNYQELFCSNINEKQVTQNRVSAALHSVTIRSKAFQIILREKQCPTVIIVK